MKQKLNKEINLVEPLAENWKETKLKNEINNFSAIRTVIIRSLDEEKDKQKPVLFLTNGFGEMAAFYYSLLPFLVGNYKVILFDNMDHGLNTRRKSLG